MKKILLYGAIVLSLNSFAQTPNYVPTNGLIGWWPFNGNANDVSGNGNDGSNFGAIDTTDRFGQANSAYLFSNSYIEVQPISAFNGATNFTWGAWVFLDSAVPNTPNFVLSRGWDYSNGFNFHLTQNGVTQVINGFNAFGKRSTAQPMTNNWHHVAISRSGSIVNFYMNGSLDTTHTFSSPVGTNSELFYIGVHKWIGQQPGYYPYYFKGKIDDVGIWNRALNQQEITNLYNSVNCANNTSITPQINSLFIASAASFTATTSDPSPNFIWQSDLGQGFQSLNNFGNYSGVNTNMLSLANIQLSEHNQEIRAISTSGNCIDTSNVAVINILDTCITNVTVTDTTYIAINDTTFISVTDTLIINAILTGLNPPNNQNTLKVFPNPASTHITIDYGNFSSMGGYTLKITNNLGQVVFTTPINQQSSYIDLSTWSGTGIYFVEIIDTQNNTIENRKILIQ